MWKAVLELGRAARASAVLLSAALTSLVFAAEALPRLSVMGVARNDVLNLREQPDARSRIVGRLASTASGIAIIGQASNSLDWIMVESAGMRGWANARFLAYGDPRQQARLPVRLRCAGTEPFWGIEVGYGRADVNLASQQQQRRMVLGAPVPAAGRPRIWLLPSGNTEDRAPFIPCRRKDLLRRNV